MIILCDIILYYIMLYCILLYDIMCVSIMTHIYTLFFFPALIRFTTWIFRQATYSQEANGRGSLGSARGYNGTSVPKAYHRALEMDG